CLSCQGSHAWCSGCAVAFHRHLPFHTLQRWTGKLYDSVTLYNLGFIWYLGHGSDPCPNNAFGSGTDDSCDSFTVVHSTGIFIHRLKWCRCEQVKLEDRHLQLLQARMFSSTTSKPQTAFTFEVLNHFLIDSLECKTSAMSFYQKLRRLTNNPFPDAVPVRLRIII
ncbi:hypothetical protein PAXINDRAFT_79775, partial [Paxillus involutus ATCC 200175]